MITFQQSNMHYHNYLLIFLLSSVSIVQGSSMKYEHSPHLQDKKNSLWLYRSVQEQAYSFPQHNHHIPSSQIINRFNHQNQQNIYLQKLSNDKGKKKSFSKIFFMKKAYLTFLELFPQCIPILRNYFKKKSTIKAGNILSPEGLVIQLLEEIWRAKSKNHYTTIGYNTYALPLGIKEGGIVYLYYQLGITQSKDEKGRLVVEEGLRHIGLGKSSKLYTLIPTPQASPEYLDQQNKYFLDQCKMSKKSNFDTKKRIYFSLKKQSYIKINHNNRGYYLAELTDINYVSQSSADKQSTMKEKVKDKVKKVKRIRMENSCSYAENKYEVIVKRCIEEHDSNRFAMLIRRPRSFPKKTKWWNNPIHEYFMIIVREVKDSYIIRVQPSITRCDKHRKLAKIEILWKLYNLMKTPQPPLEEKTKYKMLLELNQKNQEAAAIRKKYKAMKQNKKLKKNSSDVNEENLYNDHPSNSPKKSSMSGVIDSHSHSMSYNTKKMYNYNNCKSSNISINHLPNNHNSYYNHNHINSNYINHPYQLQNNPCYTHRLSPNFPSSSINGISPGYSKPFHHDNQLYPYYFYNTDHHQYHHQLPADSFPHSEESSASFASGLQVDSNNLNSLTLKEFISAPNSIHSVTTPIQHIQ